MQTLWEQTGLERRVAHCGYSVPYRIKKQVPGSCLWLRPKLPEPPGADRVLFAPSLQCGHSALFLLSGTSDSLSGVQQSYFDHYPSHGPLINTEYLSFPLGWTPMVAKRCNGKDKVGSLNSRALFSLSLSHFLVQNGVTEEWPSTCDRRGMESSLMARALEVALKLSYLTYKMGMSS